MNNFKLSKQYNIVLGTITSLVLIGIVAFSSSQIINFNRESQIKNVHKEIEAINGMIKVAFNNKKIEIEKLHDKYKALYNCEFNVNESDLMKVGEISLPKLNCNDKVITNNHEIPDLFLKDNNVWAGVFQKQRIKGEDVFIRVSTSTKKENGERAVGVPLDKSHAAYQSLISGKEYVGFANTANKHLITKYEPVKDKKGNVVAIIGVAALQTDFINELRKELSNIVIGKTGYIVVMNATNDSHKGDFLVHPKLAGENAYKSSDSLIKDLVKNIIDDKKDNFYYQWKNAEGKTIDKLYVAQIEPNINWSVGAALTLDELDELGILIRKNLSLISLISLAIILSTIFLMMKKLENNFKLLNKTMINIGNGDLTINLNYKKDSQNEFDILKKNINISNDNIKQILNKAQNVAKETKKTSDSLSYEVKQIINSSQKQADETSLIASNVEELITSIEEVASQTDDLGNVATENKKKAEESSNKMLVLVNEVELILKNSQLAKDNTENLAKEVKSINSIVSVIKAIAEQTNLLALNAAIEAARAGDAGRGFAVVADEVRKLAEKSHQSTNEIEEMIVKIQKQTFDSVEIINQNFNLVKKSNQVAQETKESLDVIINNTNKNLEAIQNIIMATKEQSTTGQSIGQSIETISHQAEQNVDFVKASLEETFVLNNQTKELSSEIAKFKIE